MLEEVPTLSPEHKAERLALLFESSWPKTSENSSHPVRTTLLRCLWKEILFTAILAIVRLGVMYVGPVLIQSLVDFTSDKRSSLWQGYYLVLILLDLSFFFLYRFRLLVLRLSGWVSSMATSISRL
ncbi:hypothetical protein ARALYDRAFT_921095 [Arabidopsis lyrata subsp. lyrata]|uniref:Uncharacterized protein n=1 Tax=Arabidopsis lyrata subsp. lyrata TaxID=81972 RepID=D7MYC8_ARALL|nr:hypothetical protein ARALYDRAFT_921095 [Arabidopsis lyrata subsp. lyrata]